MKTREGEDTNRELARIEEVRTEKNAAWRREGLTGGGGGPETGKSRAESQSRAGKGKGGIYFLDLRSRRRRVKAFW
jgi:hypothetical protein